MLQFRGIHTLCALFSAQFLFNIYHENGPAMPELAALAATSYVPLPQLWLVPALGR